MQAASRVLPRRFLNRFFRQNSEGNSGGSAPISSTSALTKPSGFPAFFNAIGPVCFIFSLTTIIHLFSYMSSDFSMNLRYLFDNFLTFMFLFFFLEKATKEVDLSTFFPFLQRIYPPVQMPLFWFEVSF